MPLSSRSISADLNANRGPNALAADIAPRACAIVAVGLRIYARRIGGSRLLWDDWLILVVAILFIPAIAVESVMVDLGLGRHIQWVAQNKPSGLPLYAKLAYFDQLIYAPLIAPIKCSILYLYLRIFGLHQSMRWACLVQIALVIVWGLVTFFLFVFQCRPVQMAWNHIRPEHACFIYAPLFIGTNTVNVIMDFGILVTPLPSIWQLNLAPAKKAWVSSILMLGACGTIFSASRLGVLSQLNFIDVTWDHADALIWSTVETSVGVFCACIPVMGPLLPHSSTPTHQSAPRKAYTRFGRSGSTKPSRAESGEDQYELVAKGNAAVAEGRSECEIYRTVDWEVSTEARGAANNSSNYRA